MLPRLDFAITIVALTSLIAGCGDRSGKVTVRGTVSWEGQPVTIGAIEFFSTENEQLVGSGPIKDGAFTFPSKPGKMRVQIIASRDLPGGGVDERLPPAEQYIPARYNSESTLTAEVTLDGKNHFEFALTEKP